MYRSGHGVGGASGGQMQSVHFRAHSSPASLDQTLSVALAQPLLSSGSASGGSSGNIGPDNHSLQGGWNGSGSRGSSTGNLSHEPLPPGWEQATTAEGKIYYIK